MTRLLGPVAGLLHQAPPAPQGGALWKPKRPSHTPPRSTAAVTLRPSTKGGGGHAAVVSIVTPIPQPAVSHCGEALRHLLWESRRLAGACQLIYCTRAGGREPWAAPSPRVGARARAGPHTTPHHRLRQDRVLPGQFLSVWVGVEEVSLKLANLNIFLHGLAAGFLRE
ncbi:unnamed protein product [Lepidochelys olivacea]